MAIAAHLPGLVAVATLAFLVCRAVYRVSLHPLAKVPGPKHYALTNLFHFRRLVRGDWDAHLKTLHDKYGPAVRTAPDSVSFITPNAGKTIYGHKSNSDDVFRKDKIFYTRIPSTVPDIVFSDGEDHRRMRRVLAHAFSDKALQGQSELIKSYVDLFISRMAEKAASAESINIVMWYNFITFDLIGDLAFGKPFGMLEGGVYHPWVAMIFQGVRKGVLSQIFTRYPLFKPLAAYLTPKQLVHAYQENSRLARETALQRLKSEDETREDFTSYILRNNNSNDEKVRARGLSEDEFVQNARVLIVAGSETTATLLSGASYFLLMNPDKYDKLVTEIRSTFSSDEEITMLTVNNLEYENAVFNESFRMYPPTPSVQPRVAPQGGETIEGYYIPAKTSVAVHQWSAYQSEQNFFEPQHFHPERWLSSVYTSDPRFINDKRDVLQPFLQGPRVCLGKNLAYAEMRLILTRLLYNFDLELQPESKNWNDQRIFALWEKGELMVKVKPAKR